MWCLQIYIFYIKKFLFPKKMSTPWNFAIVRILIEILFQLQWHSNFENRFWKREISWYSLYIQVKFSDSYTISKLNTVKLDFKELLNKEQIDFKELFNDYQLFYTINLLLNKELWQVPIRGTSGWMEVPLVPINLISKMFLIIKKVLVNLMGKFES